VEAPIPAGDRLWRWGTWLEEPPGDEPPAGEVRLKLLQFNMCGSKCNRGRLGIVDALTRSIVERGADLVLLNEACLNQVESLNTRLRGRGFVTSGCFGASTGRSLCAGAEGERWYGNAVFASGPAVGAPDRWELANRPTASEKRNVTSMQAVLKGRGVAIACAHLSPEGGDGYNERQVSEVAGRYNSMAREGKTVVLGGDFNTGLDRLRSIYLPSGSFSEIDDVGRAPTFKTRKIDFIFLSYPHFTAISGRVTRSRFSDHRPLAGEATLVTG
jgi:endonuclease/exonuclease/phosphatase family metal-dependent hydrolase